MRFLIILLVGLVASGCTPAMKQNFAQQWDDLKGHDYYNTFWGLTGFHELFPDDEAKVAAMENEMCFHTRSHERVFIANNLNDAVYYRQCFLAPSTVEMQRLEGRPGAGVQVQEPSSFHSNNQEAW